MPSNQQSLTFSIRAVNEASSTLRQVQGDLERTGQAGSAAGGHLDRMSGALGKVGQIAAGFVIGQALYNLPGLLSSAANAAAEDAASQVRLQKAVENTGVSFASHATSIQALIKHGQDLAFTDDASRSALALLEAQTGNTEEAQKRLTIAYDLSRGANIDLGTAAKLLGKVTEENVNVLGRYGIVVSKGTSETELFGLINQKFAGQAEAFANSTAGQFARTKDAMSEAKEAIGRALLPIMQDLGDFVRTILVPAINALADGLKFVVDAVHNLPGPIQDVIKYGVPMAGVLWGISAAAGAAGISLGVGGLLGALGGLAGFLLANPMIVLLLGLGAVVGGQRVGLFGGGGGFIPGIGPGQSGSDAEIKAAIAAQQAATLSNQIGAGGASGHFGGDFGMATSAPFVKAAIDLGVLGAGLTMIKAKFDAVTSAAGGAGGAMVDAARNALDAWRQQGDAMEAAKLSNFQFAQDYQAAWREAEAARTATTIKGSKDRLKVAQVEAAATGNVYAAAIQAWAQAVGAIGGGTGEIPAGMRLITVPHAGGVGMGYYDPSLGMQNFLDQYVRMGGTLEDAIKAIAGVGTAVLGFQHGGIVPGPLGAPQLAVVHGGETVTPAGQGVEIHYHQNGPVFGMLDFERAVRQTITDALRGGSFRGLVGAV